MTGVLLRVETNRARAGIAITLALNAGLMAIMALGHATYSSRSDGPAAWLGGGAAFYAVGSGLTLATLVGAWMFGRGENVGRWGLACLVASSALWDLANSASGNLLVENVAPGACLFGWLVGRAYARAVGLAEVADRIALRGAASAFGIGYVSSVFSKLRLAGRHWASPALVWSTVYSHRSVDGHGLSRAAADWLLSSPALARSGAVATLVLESATILLLGSARWRLLGAAAVIATHVGFLLFHGSTSFIPVLVALVFLVEAHQARRIPDALRAPPDARLAARVLHRSVLLAVLAVGGSLLVGHLLGR